MKTHDFYYDLPEELIAQTPVEPRDHSRMLVVHREDGRLEHKHFYDIVDYLRPGDVLAVSYTHLDVYKRQLYDLLGWVKSDLISKFYVDADDELPDVREALDIANEIGAISAYAYLGDVGSSVTGDKRAQKFEDDYLDELIPYIKELGFKAVTYMPSRLSLIHI